MSGPWIAAFLLLAGLVVLPAVFVLGIGQRVLRALDQAQSGPTAHTHTQSEAHDRATGAHEHLVPSTGLALGTPAPALPAFSRTGLQLAEVQGPRLVLFVECGCEPCVVLVTDLRRRRLNHHGVHLVAVVDDPVFGERLPDQWSLVVDGTGQLATGWNVDGTPHATVVNTAGDVVATAFPNTRREVAALLARFSRTSRQNGGAFNKQQLTTHRREPL